MKCVLLVLLSFLLFGLFVVAFVEAGGGSGSNESGGSGSHEKHDKHKHKRRGHHHNQHVDYEDESGSRLHHNRPAFIPQFPGYPQFYDMPLYQPYGGLYGPMEAFYDGKQIIQPPLIHGVPYTNYFYPPGFQPAVGGVAYRGQAGALSPQATQSFSPGVTGYPGSAALPALPTGYSPVAGTAYAGYGAALPPQAASGNPSQSAVQASGSAATLPLPQATLGHSGTAGSNGGSASGITSSSLDHHLKENREYEETGHKYSVNNY